MFPQIAIATPQARRLQHLMALRVAPAFAAGAIAFNHSGRAGEGMLIFAAMLTASWLTQWRDQPRHLMPIASLATGAVAVLAGAILVQFVYLGVGDGLTFGEYVAPVVGAWIVLAFAFWTNVRFERRCEVRIAAVGGSWRRGLQAELADAGVRGHRVVGWIDCEAGVAAPSESATRLGSVEQAREVVIDHNIDLLVYEEDSDDCSDLFDQLATVCMDLPVRMIAAGQLYEEMLGHVPLGAINTSWFRYVMHPSFRPTSPLSKRLLDLALAVPATLFAAPLIAAAALAIKLSDGGPIFYRQRRVGEGGRVFEIVKLRSMRTDAEASGQATWSKAEDDRVTSLGRFLRRSHIDELPQLWNVLRGEMSLVGPRPERPSIVAELEQQLPCYDRRHLMKPGITGWAQVRCGYAGSESGTAWKLCHDLYYLKHRSVRCDLTIMLETLHAVAAIDQYGLKAPQPRLSRPAPDQVIRVMRQRPEARLPLLPREHEGSASCQFLTSHAHVLVCLSLEPTARMRDIAQRVGITERRAQAVVSELVETGYLHRERAGRRNVYTVRRELPLHHPLWEECSIGEILDARRGAERLDACLSRLAGREVELGKAARRDNRSAPVRRDPRADGRAGGGARVTAAQRHRSAAARDEAATGRDRTRARGMRTPQHVTIWPNSRCGVWATRDLPGAFRAPAEG